MVELPLKPYPPGYPKPSKTFWVGFGPYGDPITVARMRKVAIIRIKDKFLGDPTWSELHAWGYRVKKTVLAPTTKEGK